MARPSLITSLLFLQGDHTNVDFRNMVLRPVVK